MPGPKPSTSTRSRTPRSGCPTTRSAPGTTGRGSVCSPRACSCANSTTPSSATRRAGRRPSVADIYGSAWITNGTGSIILLTGDPGDPIVGFLHLRAPANTVGPYKLIHDQDAGTFDIHDQTDLLSIARASGIHGVTATAAASAIFDATKPTTPQVEKARRRLDKLVDKGLVQRVEGSKGGVQGGTPTVWYAT